MLHKTLLLSEMLAGEIYPLMLDGHEVILLRQDDGSVSAFEDRCSHADVPLSGGCVEDGAICCPAHGARFDARDGRVLCMPATAGLVRYQVEVRGEEVWIDVP